MADDVDDRDHASVGAWAKRYYFAVRAAMESVLRLYDLGTTEWYVLPPLSSQVQRQRVLEITGVGVKLWEELPDPLAVIRAISFQGANATEMATALRILQRATHRLNSHMEEGEKSC